MMHLIYLTGIDSIIESMYLGEDLSSKISECKILVNPDSVRFVVGKTVIINSTEYDYNKYLPTLLDNNCKIISRIKIDGFEEYVDFEPYILRVCPDVQWNGKISSISDYDNISSIMIDEICDFDLSNYKLYFPKLDYSGNEKIKAADSAGNLTCLGWTLQQVGINIKSDTPFTNLDILKLGKITFE